MMIMAKEKQEELKADELAFIDEYLVCNNATQAYKIVHPKSSYDAARVNACRLLSKVAVKEEVRKRMKEHAMPAHEVLKRLTDYAGASLYPFIKIEGKKAYIDLNNSEAQKHLYLIKDLKQSEKESYNEKSGQSTSEHWVEIKLHDALKALELLGKYHALFTEKVETTERKVIRVTVRKESE